MRGKGCRIVIQSSQHPFRVAHAFAQVFLSLDMQEKPYCTNGDHHTDRPIHIKLQKGIFTSIKRNGLLNAKAYQDICQTRKKKRMK